MAVPNEVFGINTFAYEIGSPVSFSRTNPFIEALFWDSNNENRIEIVITL